MAQSRIEELLALKKAGKITAEEQAELSKLMKESKSNRGAKRKFNRQHGKQSKSAGGYGPGNDFEWWNKYPELIRDSANFKCNYVAGTQIGGADLPYTIPGILCVELHSTYGSSATPTDPINVWARDLYLKMFQKYRPASGYAASDLGITIIAALEVVKLIAEYERIYGVINRYSVMNVNMPDGEAVALGISTTVAAQLRAHLSDFRYDLNSLLMKAQRLCIPKDLSEISDAISLFGYEYLDHDSARSQIILFHQMDCGLYDENSLVSGGAVKFEGINFFNFNADNMCEALDVRLNALLGSDSVQRIFADLVVWFGQEAMLQILPVPEDFVVVPVYREEMLHKLHNLESIKAGADKFVSAINTDLDASDIAFLKLAATPRTIYQCDDRIITKFGIASTAGTVATVTIDGLEYQGNSATPRPSIEKAHILDTYRLDASPDVVVEGVLFKHVGIIKADNNNYVKVIESCAFYVTGRLRLISMASGVPTATYYQNFEASAVAAAQAAGNLAIIDWAPLVYYVNTSGVIVFVAGDMDNVIPMYANDLSRLHRATLLSGLKTDQPVKL